MADKKISDLPAAGAVADTDLYPTSQAGTTGKGTIAQLVTRLKAALLDILPVWTGNPWRWNGAEIRHLFGETGVAADTGLWELNINAGVYSLRTRTDADGAGENARTITRVGTALTSIDLGNATSNPAYNFLGIGYVNGAIFQPTANAVSGVNAAITQPSFGMLGFVTFGNLRAYFDTTGQLVLSTAGRGLSIAEGANAKMGTATLVGGTVTVDTTAVTANSRIFTDINGGTLTNIGAHYEDKANRVAGTSFVIKSVNVLDTSDIVWFIFEPA